MDEFSRLSPDCRCNDNLQLEVEKYLYHSEFRLPDLQVPVPMKAGTRSLTQIFSMRLILVQVPKNGTSRSWSSAERECVCHKNSRTGYVARTWYNLHQGLASVSSALSALVVWLEASSQSEDAGNYWEFLD